MSVEQLLEGLPPHLAERARAIRAGETTGKFVLYWMHNAVRAHENPSLDVALLAGEKLGLPVFVYHALSARYPYASDRHHTFILEGARDVSRQVRERGIGYGFHLERPGRRGPHLKTLAEKAALLITDEMPVQPRTKWLDRLAAAVGTPIWCVDTACVAPTQLIGKAYERAFDYRNKTKRLYAERVAHPWQDVESNGHAFVPDLPYTPVDFERESIPDLVAQCEIDHSVGPVPHTVGGSSAGYERWDRFRKEGLARYAKRRNDPLVAGVSRLSPYLHYGMVSPLRIAREANEAGNDGAEKFLDELLVWRELAHVFCFYHPDHDQLSAIPAWARETLEKHAVDPRPALFDWETLARGRTGEPLWDAAQKSLLIHGELHNNVRMTWGKEILSWTDGPKAALAAMVDLNHRYALDGRDPSSFGGLLWCLGQFDRPMAPDRPITGTVRSRSAKTHARRLDPAAYLKKTTRPLVSPMPRVAVVGAGISGLACARTLQDHGIEVAVFDKGREVGGRMSTRVTRGGLTFDHGAQYFTARDPRFQRYVGSWLDQGVVARWEGKITSLGDARAGKPPASERFVGTPGMNALCRQLAVDLEVTTNARICSVERDRDGRWLLRQEGGDAHDGFDYVLLAMPPSQASVFLPPESGLRARTAAVSMKPCWAVMVTLAQPLEVDYDAAFVESDSLSWIAMTSAKPGRNPAPERWVLHGSPDWSKKRLEDDRASVEKDLLVSFEDAVKRPCEVESTTAHRWRFATPPQPLPDQCLFDAKLGLGACGDWCAGSRVEGAFLSGAALAGRVLGQLGAWSKSALTR